MPADLAGADGCDEFDLLRLHASETGTDPERVTTVRRVEAHVGDVRVSGLVWGRGDPDVLFLHGGGQNAHTWDAVLLRTDYPALALDLPGHGHSSWLPDGLYLPRQLAPLVAEAVAGLIRGPVPVVGMSLGGLTGICLAAWYPELVSELVIVDVSPGSRPERSRHITEFASVQEFSSFESMVAAARDFRPGVPEGPLRRSLRYNARPLPDGRWAWRHDRRDPPGEARYARVFQDLPSYWDVAAEVRVPTTLVVGSCSPIVTPADVARFREAIPAIEVVEVEGAGHSVQGDRPDRLVDILASRLVDEGQPANKATGAPATPGSQANTQPARG